MAGNELTLRIDPTPAVAGRLVFYALPMQPLLVLTIGQAPRHDMVAELADVMGDRAETAIATATEIATDRVMMAGADAATIEVIEVEDLPLAYLPGDARRVRVRVVADLAG